MVSTVTARAAVVKNFDAAAGSESAVLNVVSAASAAASVSGDLEVAGRHWRQ